MAKRSDNAHQHHPTKTPEALEGEIEHLVDTMEKLNSFHRRFWLGVVHGIGTAIGATLLAAAVMYLIVRTLHALGLDGLLEALNLEGLLKRFE